jgi:multiple sugar transport system substrate-binding protein
MQSDQNFGSGKYYQNIFKALKYKGKLYRLPLSIGIEMIAADRTLLNNSQVQIEDSNWDWNDFVKTAEKVINETKCSFPRNPCMGSAVNHQINNRPGNF